MKTRLRPWFRNFLLGVFLLSFCFIGSVVDFSFTLPSILILVGVIGLLGGSAYLLHKFD